MQGSNQFILGLGTLLRPLLWLGLAQLSPLPPVTQDVLLPTVRTQGLGVLLIGAPCVTGKSLNKSFWQHRQNLLAGLGGSERPSLFKSG